MNYSDSDFSIRRLGVCNYNSPIVLSDKSDDCIANYVTDDQRVVYQVDVDAASGGQSLLSAGLFEKAGPRQRIFFEPAKVHAAILTAGGLCPGLNDVIRSIVMTLWYRYGVRQITGLRYGYRGLYDSDDNLRVKLEPDTVRDIHRTGGTVLGSSRGGGERMADMAGACSLRKSICYSVLGVTARRKAQWPLAGNSRGSISIVPLSAFQKPSTTT